MVQAGRVVYVCQTFPWVTQSFTVREVAMLRELGVEAEVVAFARPDPSLIDDAGRELLPHTLYVPAPSSPGLAAALLWALGNRPTVTLRHLAFALTSPGLRKTTWAMRLRSALAVVRGAWLARHLPEVGIYHAEFSDEAATAAMVAAELAGRPFSFKSHACFNSKQLERKSRRAAFIATESEFTRRYYFGEQPPERVLVNRGGVVGEPFPHRIHSGPLRILCIATLQEKKGHRYLLGALRRLKERSVPFHCMLVGSGPLEQELRALAESYELARHVDFKPYVPHAAAVDLYRGHDVLALPCVVAADGDRDGLPAVLIEAAAAGCVLVSTPVSGIPELIEDGRTGLLAPERDEEALADALARLAAEPELRVALSAAAQKLVRERFDLSRNVAELAERLGRAVRASGRD